jgi:hypothetical protein
MKNKKALRIEVTDAREMTDKEVEAVASLLFRWWRREYERGTEECVQKGLENL